MNKTNQVETVFRADPAHVETLKRLKESIHGVCKNRLMNRYVRVELVDGQTFDGVIVAIDHEYVYLSLAEDGATRWFNPYSPFGYAPFYPGGAILPLVLYNLLAISLLYP